jgi:hypothetical protein
MRDTLPKIKLLEPLLIMIGVVVGILWLINTLNTGNPLWFAPVQPTYEPSRIIVRDYGTAVTVQPGHPHYQPLSEALNAAFADFQNTDLVGIGLSEDTLRRYAEQELVLEVYYPEPIRFNTPVRMRNVNQLLIPIDATHANKNYVFIGSNGRWLAGAMVMANAAPLAETMRRLGYLEETQ